MSIQPILCVDDVSKSFGAEKEIRVLEGVKFTVNPGEKTSLIGPSGCGKSTLLSLIAGLLTPDSGTIEIDGVSLNGLTDAERSTLRAARIGIALQSDNLVPFLSAVENVELALAFGSRPSRRARRRRAMELLDQFAIADRATHLPRRLSGGEAQRVALAVSVANAPALLLADEVVAQLDGETAGEVVQEVLDADFAVLYVTHDVALADRADHRYRLHDLKVESR